MTNGEKIKEIFPSTDSRLDERTGIMLVKWVDGATKCFKADWWNAEYKEPTNKNDLGVDTDKLIADCEKMSFDFELFGRPMKAILLDAVKNIVKELPSVTPIRPKGHWISRWHAGHDLHFHVCSECNEEFSCDMETGISIDDYRYCPNCGADMRTSEENDV